MDAMRMAGFSVASAAVVLVLRRLRPEMGVAAALCCGALLLGMAAPLLGSVIGAIGTAAHSGGVSDTALLSLMKVGGVSLLMDFAAQTCRDAGEEGLAHHAELAGRLMLIALALPYMQALLTQVLQLAP